MAARMTGRSRAARWAAALAFAGFGAAAPAWAQDAANGQVLYTMPIVSGQPSCGSSACHGPLTNPQNRIFNGGTANTIKSATRFQAQMRFLETRLTDAQYNDLAAYIARELALTPVYLPVAAQPSPTLTPASVNFGAVNVMSAAPAQTFTVGNAAGAAAPLVLGAIATTAGSDYALAGGTCAAGQSLAAGSSCTVMVGFTPTAAGTRSGQLSVAHNGSAGSSTASLTGSGATVTPVAALTPTTLSFAQTLGTTSDPLRVMVSNTGTGALRLTAVRLAGTNASDFALVADAAACAAGASIAAGQSCPIDVRFTPGAQGARSGTLVVEHNAAGGMSSVTLAGTGNSTPQPGLQVDVTSLDLGSQPVGTAGTPRTITVTNNGQAELRLSRIAVAGATASSFNLAGTCAVNTPVAARASCTVTVAFAPTATGAVTGSLELASNAATPLVSVALRGTGAAAPMPAVSVAPAALSFGTVTIGTPSAARTLRLTNSGTAALQLAGLASSSSQFALSHDCTPSLAAGASCLLRVVFTPTGTTASAMLRIDSNAQGSPLNIALTGSGSTTALPVLDWTEGSAPLAFANATVGGSSTPLVRTLVNRGPGSATLTTLTVAGADPGAFVLGGGSCTVGAVLAVNGSCTVNVRFSPSTAGTRSALLQALSNGAAAPELALAGTGAGSAASSGSLMAEPGALDYRSAEVISGKLSDPLTVSLVNQGMTPTTLMSVTVSRGFVLLTPNGEPNRCPGVPWVLQPGSRCDVAVAFAPFTGGDMQGSLSVTGSEGQAMDVALTGTAITKMTNVGSAENGGGGALGSHWLALLALACLVIARHAINEPKEDTR